MKQNKKIKTCKLWPILIICLLFLVGCANEYVDQRTDYKYNLTGMGNATGIVELFQLVNSDLMHGMLGIELLFAIWIITFMAFLAATGGSGMKAFATSSYICFIINLFFLGLGVVPAWTIFFTIIATAISVIFIKE